MSDKQVLIVDDSPILRKSIRRSVLHAGVEQERIVEAGNGAEALAVLEALDVALILLDLHMPVMDGIAFLKEYRQRYPQSTTPVVVVSTESNVDRLDEVRAHGAENVIRKPFEPEEIREYLFQREV